MKDGPYSKILFGKVCEIMEAKNVEGKGMKYNGLADETASIKVICFVNGKIICYNLVFENI